MTAHAPDTSLKDNRKRNIMTINIKASGIQERTMTDFQSIRLSIDRSRPGSWTVSISNPPINVFVPATIVELEALR